MVADLASVSKNEARSRCSTMPRTAGCCLIVLLTELLDHAFDRRFPGEPAQGVETRVAPHAQIHTVLLLNGRGERVAALQTNWPDPSFRALQPRMRGSSLLLHGFDILFAPF